MYHLLSFCIGYLVLPATYPEAISVLPPNMADEEDRILKVGYEFPDCSSFLKKVQEIGNAQGVPFTRRDTHKTSNHKAGKVVYNES